MAHVQVTFETDRSDWKLTVADNGLGRRESDQPSTSTGLGTALIAALAKQLSAEVNETSSRNGLTVTITKATFRSRLPHAA